MSDLGPPGLRSSLSPRPAPVIFQIPSPPPYAARAPKVFAILAACEAVAGVIVLPVLPRPVNYILGSVLLFQAAIFGGVAAWMSRRLRLAAAKDRPPQQPGGAPDPLVERLRELWRDGMRYPRGRRLYRALRENPPTDPSRARIVSLGHVDVPRVREMHFEPEIITPTRYLGRNLVVAAFGLVFVALAIAKWTRAVPWVVSIPLNSFGYFYGMLAVMGGAWLYRSTIRPTYVRLAPGVIEIVRYSMRGGPPQIWSYPMTAGTTVLLYAPWWGGSSRIAAPPTTLEFGDVTGAPRRPLKALLYRDGEVDTVSFHQMRASHELVDRLWQALLSTAPTPPLSREELVG